MYYFVKQNLHLLCMKKLWFVSIAIVAIIGAYSFMPTPSISTKAQLGEKLFNDKILSKDVSISCASCHKPAFGFADTVPFSTGIYGKLTTRNTPSVLNMFNRPYFFWDGRAATLQQQSLMPISHPNEMGLPIKEAIARLNNSKEYKALFLKIFKQVPTAKNLSAAIAAFENTLETGRSKFDLSVDDKDTLTNQEERGRQLFIGDKTHCFDCHRGDDFTNDDFRNIGLYDGDELNDKGRYTITKDTNDVGKFKVPSLRNIAITAPYMHNGKFKTLEQVVEYYNNPTAFVSSPINIDKTLAVPLGLNKQEKADLVAFLKTLTDRRFMK
jgi:cytochrome c peroxidase